VPTKKDLLTYLGSGVSFLVLMLIYSASFIVPEGNRAIVTQFGRPIAGAERSPGLNFKLPFVQDARFIDSRILSWDGSADKIPTRDKKYIWVDTTARWKIVDILKFMQTVTNEKKARSTLDTILDAATRDMVSKHNLVETVRNSNSIFDRIAEAEKKRAQLEKDSDPSVVAAIVEEEVTGDIDKIEVGRERLSQMIKEKAEIKLEEFGIELIDVQIRRIAYEESVQEKVYDRMISERKRIAEKIRSVGRGEQAKIEGKINRDLKKIESEAYRKAETIKGKADAKAIKIYADAFSKDPKFFEFIRTMDAYKKSMTKPGTDFILSTDSDFLGKLSRE